MGTRTLFAPSSISSDAEAMWARPLVFAVATSVEGPIPHLFADLTTRPPQPTIELITKEPE